MSDGSTARNSNTITAEQVEQLLGIIKGKPMLTPKEANRLTYTITELLMSGNCTSRCLRLLGRYLSTKAYEDIVEERVIAHCCGYPLCTFTDPSIIKDVQVNKLAKSLRMPCYYKSRFCCKDHYLCSEFYKHQLSTDALFMRIGLDKEWFSNDSVECQIVLLDEYLANGRQDDLTSVISTLRSLNVEDSVQKHTNELITQFQNIKVMEHEGAQISNDNYI